MGGYLVTMQRIQRKPTGWDQLIDFGKRTWIGQAGYDDTLTGVGGHSFFPFLKLKLGKVFNEGKDVRHLGTLHVLYVGLVEQDRNDDVWILVFSLHMTLPSLSAL